MNIVIPLVGEGKRFKEAGFKTPKPLIKVCGKTVLEHAVSSLGLDGNYMFVIRKTEYSDQIRDILLTLKPSCTIIETAELTEGSACSISLLRDFINNDQPLLTTNCDQVLKWNPKKFQKFCETTTFDGVVATYPFGDIKLNSKSPYSFVKLVDGCAVDFMEKFAISEDALCGIHFWRKGKDFISSAQKMFEKNDRVNNEFYVSTAYKHFVESGGKVTAFKLSEEQFYSLGTPEDLFLYEAPKT